MEDVQRFIEYPDYHEMKFVDGLGRYPRETYVRKHRKVGRNEKCPCDSGNKYKRCCGKGF